MCHQHNVKANGHSILKHGTNLFFEDVVVIVEEVKEAKVVLGGLNVHGRGPPVVHDLREGLNRDDHGVDCIGLLIPLGDLLAGLDDVGVVVLGLGDLGDVGLGLDDVGAVKLGLDCV